MEDRISFLTEKYSLNPENLLGIHYRGTDKAKEIVPPHLAIVLRDAQEILLTNPGLKVLVQTDDLRAQEYFSSNLGDFSITINELKTSFGSVGAHYRSSARHNAISVVDYLATVQILSKCAYLITHTGHGALWEVLYRGNTENVIQR